MPKQSSLGFDRMFKDLPGNLRDNRNIPNDTKKKDREEEHKRSRKNSLVELAGCVTRIDEATVTDYILAGRIIFLEKPNPPTEGVNIAIDQIRKRQSLLDRKIELTAKECKDQDVIKHKISQLDQINAENPDKVTDDNVCLYELLNYSLHYLYELPLNVEKEPYEEYFKNIIAEVDMDEVLECRKVLENRRISARKLDLQGYINQIKEKRNNRPPGRKQSMKHK